MKIEETYCTGRTEEKKGEVRLLFVHSPASHINTITLHSSTSLLLCTAGASLPLFPRKVAVRYRVRRRQHLTSVGLKRLWRGLEIPYRQISAMTFFLVAI